jgi:hypothetical protein
MGKRNPDGSIVPLAPGDTGYVAGITDTTVSHDGTVLSADGKPLGKVRADGMVVGPDGRVIGKRNPDGSVTEAVLVTNTTVDADGTVRGPNGRPLGKMAADGTVTDLDGKVVGKMNADGSIVSVSMVSSSTETVSESSLLSHGSVRLEVAELERETALLRQQSELETAFQVKLQKHGDGIRAAMQAELAMEQQNKRQGVDRNKAARLTRGADQAQLGAGDTHHGDEQARPREAARDRADVLEQRRGGHAAPQAARAGAQGSRRRRRGQESPRARDRRVRASPLGHRRRPRGPRQERHRRRGQGHGWHELRSDY